MGLSGYMRGEVTGSKDMMIHLDNGGIDEQGSSVVRQGKGGGSDGWSVRHIFEGRTLESENMGGIPLDGQNQGHCIGGLCLGWLYGIRLGTDI